MKRCLITVVIREMQKLSAQWENITYLSEWLKLKRQTMLSVDKGVKDLELIHCCWDYKIV